MKSVLSTLAAALLLAPSFAAAQEAAPEAPSAEASAPAEASPGGLGLSVAPKLGATLATSELGPTFFAGVDVLYQLPVLERRLGVGVEVAFGQPGLAGGGTSPVAGDYTYTLDGRWVTASVDALGFLPLGPVEAYGGLGYGLYLLRVENSSFDQTTVENQMRTGLQVRAGAGYGLGPGRLFAEARYHYVGLEFLTTGEANGGGITFAAGYRFGF
ncbi:MAG TPA: outer membrane beta-barrel protein [Myxococcaceae bacterium]|nr:outer membrane beta-barrel protein [Myxococcaceae bacterium]